MKNSFSIFTIPLQAGFVSFVQIVITFTAVTFLSQAEKESLNHVKFADDDVIT